MSSDANPEDKDRTAALQAVTAGHGKTQPQLPLHSPLEQVDTNFIERNSFTLTTARA